MERKRLLVDVPGITINGEVRLTLSLVNSFCELIMRGLPADAACDFLGIASSTYYYWLRKGEKHINEGKESGAREFVQRFRKALATYRLTRVDRLHDPCNRNWYKEMAILERRDRRTYGRQETAGGNDEQYDPDERFL